LFAIALLAFVSLGLPDGVLGVAWPSIRATFALPLSQLGVLLGAAMVGYLAASVSSGPIVARIGIGRLLVLSSAAVAASSLGYALAPRWGLMVAAGVLAGLGAGAIDAGINAFAAAVCSPRQVSWLHAAYGIGAMLGPLLMSGVLATGLGWRVGYLLIAAGLGGMMLCFLGTLPRWETARDGSAGRSGTRPEPAAGFRATLARPLVWLNIVLFFVYTGLEVTAGQWTYSLLTEGRGLAPGPAGVWVSGFWGSLTAGRLVSGAMARHHPAERLLRGAMLAALAGALLLWWAPRPLVGLLGLVVLGWSFAPIYPLLIAATPGRVGAGHATTAIGLQVAAAYLGTAALPGAAGVLARWYGLERLGPFLFAGALALLLLHELGLRRAVDAATRAAVRPARNSTGAGCI
jgi:fucose permease